MKLQTLQIIRKTLILAFFSSSANAYAYDLFKDGIYYKLNRADSTAIVTSKSFNGESNSYSGDVTIPEKFSDGDDSCCTRIDGKVPFVTYTVIGIDEYAFGGSINLTSVNIPSTVKSIGSYAFQSCFNLKSVNLHPTLEYIGDEPFITSYNLTFSDSLDLRNLKHLGLHALSGHPEIKHIRMDSIQTLGIEALFNTGISDIYLPASLETIGYNAFGDCKDLKKVVFSSETKIAEVDYFSGCTSLEEITLPQTITNIGIGAFSNTALKEIIIPDNVTTISYGAFKGCSNLKTITIGRSVKYIDEAAFHYCSNITDIYVLSNIPPVCYTDAGYYSVFATYSSYVHPPRHCVDAYKTALTWANFQYLDDGNNIDYLSHKNTTRTETYDTYGRPYDVQRKGLNIIKLSNGMVKKEFIR